MKIRRCAHPWLVQSARVLVETGRRHPREMQYTWLSNWSMGVYWLFTPAWSALAYRSTRTVDASMQMQLLDAFHQTCKKNLVTLVGETPNSAICFFGGAPLDVELATLDFEAMDITRPPTI